jgi:hypothetical protein
MSTSSLLMELPPLVVAGGAMLVGLDMVHREQRTGAASPDLRRWPTIVLLFVAALAHVPVIPQHLEEAPYMGVLFIAFVAAAFTLAALLAARPTAALYRVAGALCAAAILAYAATRLVAFPDLSDDVGNWTEPLGVLSVATELGVVLVTTVASRLTAPGLRRRGTPGRV